MRLPNYDACSLQELHMFLAQRHIPFKFTRAQAHTKTLYKRDKEERLKLTTALEKADAAANIPFMELPLELRDEVYEYFLTDITTPETLTKADLREHMWQVSPQFCVEVGNVFNRGEYETLPELIDGPIGPLTPAQETCRALGMAPHNLPPHPSTFQFSTTGSMVQGRFPFVSSSYGMTRQEDFMMRRLGYSGPAKNLPRQDLEQALRNGFDKLVSLQNGVDDVLQLIPAPKPSQQTLKQYMERNAF